MAFTDTFLDPTAFRGTPALWFPVPNDFFAAAGGWGCKIALSGKLDTYAKDNSLQDALKFIQSGQKLPLPVVSSLGVSNVAIYSSRNLETILTHATNSLESFSLSTCAVKNAALKPLLAKVLSVGACPKIAAVVVEDLRMLTDNGGELKGSAAQLTEDDASSKGGLPKSLRFLSFAGAGLGTSAVRALARSLEGSELRHLVLGRNPGVAPALEDLSEAISLHTALTHLDLDGCPLQGGGLRALCEALQESAQVTAL